jgi:hypothetical protein
MLEIALFDRRHWQNNEHVGGAEFVVNHCTVTNIGAKPQVTLDQGRERA